MEQEKKEPLSTTPLDLIKDMLFLAFMAGVKNGMEKASWYQVENSREDFEEWFNHRITKI
jgi:hypothetical protein